MKAFDKLVQSLRRLPGIGPKQAERLAVHLVRAPASEAEALAEALREARGRVRTCAECLNFTEREVCELCADPGRDRRLFCVVEQPADVAAIERSRSFRGLYHVLHGRFAPGRGAGPGSIRSGELLARVRRPGAAVAEVILATDTDTEGEATALYLASLLKGLVRVTRIAQGVPLGGDIDYLDEQTLTCAISGRREV